MVANMERIQGSQSYSKMDPTQHQVHANATEWTPPANVKVYTLNVLSLLKASNQI